MSLELIALLSRIGLDHELRTKLQDMFALKGGELLSMHAYVPSLSLMCTPLLMAVLVSLYEEPDKPKQALDYIKATLGGPTPAEYEAVVAQRDSLKAQVEKLSAENEALRSQQAS